MRWTTAFFLVATISNVAIGQDTGSGQGADPTTPVRTAYDLYQKLKAERDGGATKSKDADKKCQEARERFGSAFAKVDWNVWDLATDVDLLAEGVSIQAGKAFYDGDYAVARKGFDFLVAQVPEHRQSQAAMSYTLPEIYAATGDFAGGIARLNEFVPKLPPVRAADALIWLGDLQAANGDVAAAQRTYADVATTFAKRKPGDDSARASIESALDARKLIGKQASDIVPTDCVGGKAAPLSSHKGHVVVLFQLRPVATTTFGTVKRLESLHKRLGAKGLSVIGVTSFESLGPRAMMSDSVDVSMPKEEGETGETVTATRSAFRKHVTTYRQRMKMTFPIFIDDSKSIAAYGIGAFEQRLVVIDPDQVIVHVGVPFHGAAACGIAEGVLARALSTDAPGSGK